MLTRITKNVTVTGQNPAKTGKKFDVKCGHSWRFKMALKPARKPKLTDAERHKRFVEMAKEVEASPDPKDFERAFNTVLRSKPKTKPPRKD
jgi:hypothetical protein